jgi:hypothetical protein
VFDLDEWKIAIVIRDAETLPGLPIYLNKRPESLQRGYRNDTTLIGRDPDVFSFEDDEAAKAIG